MSERAVIKERLRKKEQEIHTLEAKLASARIYVQALQDILKMLDKVGDDSPVESVLRPGSTVSQARDVILERGKPVHIIELLEALGKDTNRDSRASLTSSLAAYVRKSEVFTRPAPNTFGLIELGHQTVDDDDDEPPPSFGEATASPVDSEIDDEIPF
ncbi:MAG TPA: hypothetical protein VFE18_07755 [Phenylobacterium sp.]|jgi:hypothetical protein|uniref:hypothetical protein n=1 Tax=Phenylobacterium sp. TaxID=1871053 RepID=UPI002D5DC188|nr:hypothetical protein [Phenylobacterium sp.]HZZ68054.1 hypothetical protein [Phenylobacterium sp.]